MAAPDGTVWSKPAFTTGGVSAGAGFLSFPHAEIMVDIQVTINIFDRLFIFIRTP